MRRRRTLLAAVAAALLAAMHRVTAQTGKRRIAYLGLSTPASGGHLIAQFASGLRDLGWVEGGNLILDLRFAQGDQARWAPLTSELLALQPDVFVTTTDFAAAVAAQATRTVPIVFIYGSDPMGLGLVKSLARPGGNATGFGVLGDELEPKRLALLKEAVPGLSKVGVLHDRSDRSQGWLKQLEQASRKVSVVLVPAVIETPEDIAGAFEKVVKAGVKGLMM